MSGESYNKWSQVGLGYTIYIQLATNTFTSIITGDKSDLNGVISVVKQEWGTHTTSTPSFTSIITSDKQDLNGVISGVKYEWGTHTTSTSTLTTITASRT